MRSDGATNIVERFETISVETVEESVIDNNKKNGVTKNVDNPKDCG